MSDDRLEQIRENAIGFDEVRGHLQEVDDFLWLLDEVDRLRTWGGLISVLDEHYPPDVFDADPDDPHADPGPRIVALAREVDRLQAGIRKFRDDHAYAPDDWVIGSQGIDNPEALNRLVALIEDDQ